MAGLKRFLFSFISISIYFNLTILKAAEFEGAGGELQNFNGSISPHTSVCKLLLDHLAEKSGAGFLWKVQSREHVTFGDTKIWRFQADFKPVFASFVVRPNLSPFLIGAFPNQGATISVIRIDKTSFNSAYGMVWKNTIQSNVIRPQNWFSRDILEQLKSPETLGGMDFRAKSFEHDQDTIHLSLGNILPVYQTDQFDESFSLSDENLKTRDVSLLEVDISHYFEPTTGSLHNSGWYPSSFEYGLMAPDFRMSDFGSGEVHSFGKLYAFDTGNRLYKFSNNYDRPDRVSGWFSRDINALFGGPHNSKIRSFTFERDEFIRFRHWSLHGPRDNMFPVEKELRLTTMGDVDEIITIKLGSGPELNKRR